MSGATHKRTPWPRSSQRGSAVRSSLSMLELSAEGLDDAVGRDQRCAMALPRGTSAKDQRFGIGSNRLACAK